MKCPDVNLFAFGISIAVIVFIMTYLTAIGVLIIDHLAVYKADEIKAAQIPVFFVVITVFAVNTIFTVLPVFAFFYDMPIIIIDRMLIRNGNRFRPYVAAEAFTAHQAFFRMSCLFFNFATVFSMLFENGFTANQTFLFMILTIIVYVFIKIVVPIINIFYFVFDIAFRIYRHIKGAFFAISFIDLYTV